MAVKVSYPGVYIDEFAPGAPILPAATNIAAILGPLVKGPIVDPDVLKDPMKVTSFDQFKQVFGARPAPGFFTWYAVRGFFENGGTACYVYRITNATYAKTDLLNAKGVKLGKVVAIEPGEIDTPIQFTVQDPATPLLPAGTKLFSVVVNGTLSGTQITIPAGPDPGNGPPQDARAFRIGDIVQVSGADGTSLGPLATIQSVSPGVLVIDQQWDPQAVTIKLMYDSIGSIRITTPTPLMSNVIGLGTTIVLGDPASPKLVDVVESASGEQLTSQFKTYRLSLRNGLRDKIDPSASDVAVSAITFDVAISQDGTPYVFRNLDPDPSSDNYYVDVINKIPSLVRVVAQDPPPPVSTPDLLRPISQVFSVAGGTDEQLNNLSDNDFINPLDDLRRLGDIRLVSMPDGYPRTDGSDPKISPAVHSAIIAHCEQMADRFAVLDPEPSLPKFGDTSIEMRRRAVDSTRGYAALYYPWIRISPAYVGPPITVPPSGHICGLMARVDDTRGVFKAPANEILQGAIGVELTMSDSDQGLLNLQNINVIRVFQDGGRPYVYGARTTATDANWNYVNVRRLFLFLEKSIQDSIRWAVFEPNNKGLWAKLRQSINSFLLTQWQAGALFGDTPDKAYYVRIDDILNPISTLSLGILNMEIGVVPTYPAEFIVVRIGIWDGGSVVSEG